MADGGKAMSLPPQKRRYQETMEDENGNDAMENDAIEGLLEAELEGEDEPSAPITILLCVLNHSSVVFRRRKIWRRLAVPSNFNLLELHVALQNAFDWENMHLHCFQQARKCPVDGIPPYSGLGNTDVTALPIVDFDSLDPSEVRTYQLVVGDEDQPFEQLTSAHPECLVSVEHSHPHSDAPEGAEDRTVFRMKPKEVLEERAFLVKDVFTAANPVGLYEYDFGLRHEVTIFFEGEHETTPGVNYPTCLGGRGASRAEDGNDTDTFGNLLPSYDYDEFAVLEVVRHFEKTYECAWPLGPGAEDNRLVPRCYMCRYNSDCGRRQMCSGSCCIYCAKSAIAQAAGQLSLEEADKMADKMAATIASSRREFVETGVCNWLEQDKSPCCACNNL